MTGPLERERFWCFKLWILLLFLQVAYLLDVKHQILHTYICFRACLEVAASVLPCDLFSILPCDLPLIVQICQVNLVADNHNRDRRIVVILVSRNKVSCNEERIIIR